MAKRAPLVRVVNAREVVKQIKQYGRRKSKALVRGTRLAAYELLSDSQYYVPIYTGALRASGRVRTTGRGIGTTHHVEYTASYALYVHEDLTKAHGEKFNKKYAVLIATGGDKSLRVNSAGRVINKRGRFAKVKTHPYYFNRRPQERAKFLEIPFRQNKAKYLRIVRTTIKAS